MGSAGPNGVNKSFYVDPLCPSICPYGIKGIKDKFDLPFIQGVPLLLSIEYSSRKSVNRLPSWAMLELSVSVERALIYEYRTVEKVVAMELARYWC
jgi:hypothetical protein